MVHMLQHVHAFYFLAVFSVSSAIVSPDAALPTARIAQSNKQIIKQKPLMRSEASALLETDAAGQRQIQAPDPTPDPTPDAGAPTPVPAGAAVPILAASSKALNACSTLLTSWNNTCESGCLKVCDKNPDKICCNRKMTRDECAAFPLSIFCGDAASFCGDSNPLLKGASIATVAIIRASAACEGKLTSWGRTCEKGCLRFCKKKPGKVCCNRKMTQDQCSQVPLSLFCGTGGPQANTDVVVAASTKAVSACEGRLTSWNNTCETGCLRNCKKQPDKVCCNRKMTRSECDAIPLSLFCGDPDTTDGDELTRGATIATSSVIKAVDACAGRLTDWNNTCEMGCLRNCEKQPRKVCCNRNMTQGECAKLPLSIFCGDPAGSDDDEENEVGGF